MLSCISNRKAEDSAASGAIPIALPIFEKAFKGTIFVFGFLAHLYERYKRQKAREDFDNIDLSDVKDIDTKYGKGKQGRDSDGNSVIYSPGSKTGGSTIEIQLPGHNKIKIRY